MKKYLFALLIMGLSSCIAPTDKNKKVDPPQVNIYGTPLHISDTSDRYGFTVIIIDGCEYMVHMDGEGLCHMGTCKNPIHKTFIK